ncbi:hypothetical protein FNV43_RR09346 [Rhamnella rubrinervis]|uniref:Late embryogenesis abundant protein LEA-2 subgroup domain-containing protein n=1 Tax=Rhamnella rubrinervis TaxID=2594499 RepID=A0A8K0HB57_9ROSA|nr:hypothetical protein FNV43_RR09346 [Rhamnella rubrinervis]
MADQENHSWPMAPALIYQKSDEENPTFKAIRKERTNNKCFVFIFAGIVIHCIFILVFALIVLRPKSPDVKLRSVTVKGLRYATSPWPSFNATLTAEITIKNPNFGSFRFENTTASLVYEGVKIGGKRTSKSGVNARGTKVMNVGIDVRSSRLPEGPNNLGNDLNSGTLKLSGQAKFSGTLHLVKILRCKKTSELNCTFTLYLTSRTIKDLLCY